MSSDHTAKESITREDFFRLEGLLTLARDHNQMLRCIERAAAEISGEEVDGYSCPYFGLTSDAVSEGWRAEELVGKLELAITGVPLGELEPVEDDR